MRKTRGRRAMDWIERFCIVPHGPDKGKRVRLTEAEHYVVRQIYDGPNGPQDVPVSGVLAVYLALLHTCGVEAKQSAFRPNLSGVDVFTLWNAAANVELRRVLTRKGESIVCAGLGTSYPPRAA